MISINIGYIVVFMLNSLILGMRFSRSFYKLEKLSVKTLEQNEEISNQARQLTIANRELNRQSKVLKERNEEIERINETLELKVMERTAKLAAINTELDTFLYKSSHDLRRPIISILGLTYLAGKPGNGVDHDEIFRKITEMAMSMDKLIHKLGDLNELNDREPSFEDVDLKALIEKTKNEVCKQLKNPQNALFNVDCSPVVHTDPLIFKKILYQLFLNSAIWVDHSDYQIEINCSIKQENQYQIIMEVEDNGPGIPTEFHSEIFAMYKVADERTKSHGLGLYIVDKAIRKLKGKIYMDSKPQQGTRFIVELPVPVQL